MAKKAWIERNKKKSEAVKKYAALRAELKAKHDYAGLSKLPRNASPSRLVNRCAMSGRRQAANGREQIPGLYGRETIRSFRRFRRPSIPNRLCRC